MHNIVFKFLFLEFFVDLRTRIMFYSLFNIIYISIGTYIIYIDVLFLKYNKVIIRSK